MKKDNRVCLDQRGFTYIEIMIAVAIIVMAIVGIMSANVFIQKTGDVAYERTVALLDANRAVEKLRIAAASGNFPGNVTGSYPDNQTISGFTNLTNETVTVDYVSATANPLDTTITVSWLTSQNRTQTVVLKTLITKRSVT